LRPIRILIATHSPISAKFGAGQVAINLAEAFRRQGYDVTLWSPYPMPDLTRWWQGLQAMQLMRTKLDEFIEAQEPFDVIDCFGVLITKKVSQSALVIARSTQPDILYIVSGLLSSQDNGLKNIALFPFSCLYGLTYIFLLLQGWARADYILCLGSLELEWMKKWFPLWIGKLFLYFNTISKDEQLELAKVRLNRIQQEREGVRFIWIGRWDAHKGIKRLVEFVIQRSASLTQDTFTIAGCGTNAWKDFPPELIRLGKLKIIPSFERRELYSLLADHDVGLFTSKVEGWGLVLNEMLESGMPVFSTQAGGATDLQPFFETLMPFPPPEQLKLSFLRSSQKLEDYYDFCSWDKITYNYADILITKLDSRNNSHQILVK
jgi:glycosyltransferase involved in cell wall biosynthesis